MRRRLSANVPFRAVGIWRLGPNERCTTHSSVGAEYAPTVRRNEGENHVQRTSSRRAAASGTFGAGNTGLGESANVEWSLSAFGCNGASTKSSPLIQTGVSVAGDVSTECVEPPSIATMASAHFFVTTFSQPLGPPVLQASADTTGPGVAALADASVTERVTVSPPAGSANPFTTFQAGDTYSIQILGATPPWKWPSANLSSRSPPRGSDLLEASGCPCTYLFTVQAHASVSNGGLAFVEDPGPFLVLPEGWTYSFSTPPAPTPEPGSLLLLGSGLTALGSLAWRRHRRMARQGYRLHLTNIDEGVWRATTSDAQRVSSRTFNPTPQP